MNTFYLPQSLQWITPAAPNPVLGYYVYEYRDCNTPFYVGMGTNRRAWNEHLPLPENRKRFATRFTIYIVRHRLTKPQAHLLERTHTASLLKKGFPLLNTRIPTELLK